MMVDKSIFRAYDIRGKYPDQIDKNVAYKIGRAFGTHIKRLGQKIMVSGRDIRYSSPEIQSYFIKGVLDTGIDVINLGVVTTPMYYYGSIFLGVEAGCMITASHNPKDDNGFKFQFDGLNARGKEVFDFGDEVNKGDFDDGIGQVYHFDIKEEYIKLILRSLNINKERKLKVVLDLANATTCVIAKDVFDKFENLEIIYMLDWVDPSFPYHHPDPCVDKNLDMLKKKVLEVKADIGISYDGDGDRLGVVDNLGRHVEIDKILAIFIKDLHEKKVTNNLVYDVKCSKLLSDVLDELKCDRLMSRTGNSYIKATVNLNNLKFGGEYSGHLFFNDRFLGFDSAIYNSLRLIELLIENEISLSDMVDVLPKYYSTEEIKIKTTDDKKAKIVSEVLNYVKDKGYFYEDIDGVRVEDEDSFALIRASQTGPNLTLRFEGKTEEKLNLLKNEFMTLVEKLNG